MGVSVSFFPCTKRKRLRPPSEEERRLGMILGSAEQLDAITTRCLESLPCRTSFREADASQFLQTLAKNTGCNVSIFRDAMDIRILFARFDTDHDGRLDPSECLALVKTILRERCNELSGGSDFDIPYRSLISDYTILKKLGEGGQGAMFLASYKNNERRCVKFYKKGNSNAPLDDIKAEFRLMKQFNSPHVARSYEIFQDWCYVYLVNEPYTGKNLSSLLETARNAGVVVNESWLSEVFKQVLKGLVYIHQFGVIHCDLKEDNIMVAEDSHWHRPHVILIDFGLSKQFLNRTRSVCGTAGYIPPEVYYSGVWTHKGDVFSAGVTFFSVASEGINPFTDGVSSSDEDVLWNETERRVCSADAVPLRKLPTGTSVEFSDLLLKMMAKDFRKRPTPSVCLQHPWFSLSKDPMPTHIISQLSHVQHQSVIQMAALEHMLENWNLGHMRDLNDLFRSLDVDGDGTISITEARQALEQTGGMSDHDMNQLVQVLTGKAGKVSYTQFISRMLGNKYLHDERLLADLFHKIDVNGDGVISKEELPELVKACRYDSKLTTELMAELDADGDGKITFDEFRQACIGSAPDHDRRGAKRHQSQSVVDVKRRKF